jgi:penicillin-binding protein 1C
LGETQGQDSLLVRFERPGQIELSALDESGETARVAFQVSE